MGVEGITGTKPALKPIPWAIVDVGSPAFPLQTLCRNDGEESVFLDKLLLNCLLSRRQAL